MWHYYLFYTLVVVSNLENYYEHKKTKSWKNIHYRLSHDMTQLWNDKRQKRWILKLRIMVYITWQHLIRGRVATVREFYKVRENWEMSGKICWIFFICFLYWVWCFKLQIFVKLCLLSHSPYLHLSGNFTKMYQGNVGEFHFLNFVATLSDRMTITLITVTCSAIPLTWQLMIISFLMFSDAWIRQPRTHVLKENANYFRSSMITFRRNWRCSKLFYFSLTAFSNNIYIF